MSFLILDFGTSSCRSALFSPDGAVSVAARRSVDISYDAGGRAELDPDEAWSTAVRVLREFADSFPEEKPDALGISSLLGYVFLSGKSEILRPAILYMDGRAAAEARELSALYPAEETFRITGRRMSPELLAPKLLRLKKYEPEIFGKIRHVLGLKDELVRRLTGNIVTDWAHLNYTWLFDTSGKPHPGLCGSVGVRPDIFPETGTAARQAGRVSAEAARLTGLPEGLPVIAGSIDGTTAMYGAGLACPGSVALVSGTTDVVMTLSEKPEGDSGHRLSVNTGMIPGTFAIGGATGFSGGALRKLADLFKIDLRTAVDGLAEISPGTIENLFVVPGITGERSPYWKENAAGAIIGLTPLHGPGHIMAAAMEACVFRVSRIVEGLRSAGLRLDRIHASGGAEIPGWNRMRADATGLQVLELEEREATTLGAAMFCRAALEGDGSPGNVFTAPPRVKEVFEPGEPERLRFLEKRERFEGYLSALYGDSGL